MIREGASAVESADESPRRRKAWRRRLAGPRGLVRAAPRPTRGRRWLPRRARRSSRSSGQRRWRLTNCCGQCHFRRAVRPPPLCSQLAVAGSAWKITFLGPTCVAVFGHATESGFVLVFPINHHCQVSYRMSSSSHIAGPKAKTIFPIFLCGPGYLVVTWQSSRAPCPRPAAQARGPGWPAEVLAMSWEVSTTTRRKDGCGNARAVQIGFFLFWLLFHS